jgi:AbrB family looped-hinge helix DNA binding protein
MDVAITRMSSKGQVVIPSEMRLDIAEGEKLVIIKNDDQLIMKKASDLGKNLKDDLIFAKRTEEALKRYDKGEFVEMDFDKFLKKVRKW